MTIRDRMSLQLAATPYRYPARREADALEVVGLTPTLFWAAVGRALDDLAAVSAMPVEVARLRRLRDARRGARSAKVHTRT